MKREIQACTCKDYGDTPETEELFGHEYCGMCQCPDETEWWGEITPAQRTAWLIWNDLRGRRGFKEEIGHEIEASILEEWADIVEKGDEE
jgi:hypothetical protein